VLPSKANTTRPQHWGYDAVIDWGPTTAESLYLRTAPGPGRQMVATTGQAPQNQPNTNQNPEDFRTELGQTISRTVFSGGEGLDRAHRVEATQQDFTRYWDSRNVDVTPGRPGDPELIKLLHDTSISDAQTETNLYLAKIADELFMSQGIGVRRSVNAGSTWTNTNPAIGSITGLAVVGDELHAGSATAVAQRSSGGTWNNSWSTQNVPNGIWGAKGRVIGANGNQILEIRAGAGSVLLHTLGTNDVWTDVTDGGSAILISATDGYIYSFAEEEGELTLKGQTRIEGEVPRTVGFSQGVVFIGTSEDTTSGGKIGRLWRATLIGTRLRDAQLLRTWGDGTETRDRAPRRIWPTRDSIFTAVVEDGTETHLWRVHLATSGVSRSLILGASGLVLGITNVDDRLFATVAGSGAYEENATFATSGFLIGPMADFYTTSPKQWVGARVDTNQVLTQEQVDLAYSTNPAALVDSAHGSWVNIISVLSTSESSTGKITTEQAISNVNARWLLQRVTLTPNTARTTTPELLSYAFRALPSIDDEVILVPVVVSDIVEIPGRKRLRVKGEGERIYQELRLHEGKGILLELFTPAIKVRGLLEQVAAPIQGKTLRGSQTTFSFLSIRGIKVA